MSATPMQRAIYQCAEGINRIIDLGGDEMFDAREALLDVKRFLDARIAQTEHYIATPASSDEALGAEDLA